MKIDQSTQLIRNKDIIASEIDNEVVMMDKNFEQYFGLETIGARIWKLLDKQHTANELSEELIEEFNVSQEQCLADIMPFLTELVERELLVIT